MKTNNIIALTSGDPNSIATLITLKAWLKLKNTNNYFILLSNQNYVNQIIKYFKFNITTENINNIQNVPNIFSKKLPIININPKPNLSLGNRKYENSPFILKSLNTAILLTKSNQTAAIVTNPLDKEIINQYQMKYTKHIFTGHTEYLAKQTQSSAPVMMMATLNSSLRVAPLTTHLSLKKAINSLNQDLIINKVQIIHDFLNKYLDIKNPKIAILGLNPHAGEQGLMGKEEIDTIIPAIHKLKTKNINCHGPFPADSAFSKSNINTYHIFVGMYHDQVLNVFKTLYFDQGVNITLGLPIIRTSVDHGCAFNIAHTASATSTSLENAILYAHKLVHQIK